MATMRYRSTPKAPKVTAQAKPAEVDGSHHSGLVPFAPPQQNGSWSLESYPHVDPTLDDLQGAP